MVRGKVLGTSAGTRVAAAPDLEPAGSAAGFMGESQINGSLPCQKRFKQHQDEPGSLMSQGGNKEEVANTQGLCAPTETMDTSWGRFGP